VVETTSLSYAELPPIKYTLALPGGIFDPVSKANPYGGSLSNLQVKADLSTLLPTTAAAPAIPSLLLCLCRTHCFRMALPACLLKSFTRS
jgi:hypothetical protein